MGGPATVPMLSPDGTSGEIPADQVQAAQQAGFKRAVSMVSPDGKSTGYIPEDRVNDATKAGFRFGTTEQPSAGQLYKQALFNPVGSGASDGGITGTLEQAGGRAMQGITNMVSHPIDTLTGAYNALRHPIDTASQRVGEFQNEWKQNPSLALGNAAGDIAGTVEGGRLGSAALSGAADLAGPAINRAILLGKSPEAAYESALKPSTTLNQADRANIVQTGLQNSIPVSKSGLQNIGNLLDRYDQAVKDEIAADPTRQITTAPALRNLDSVRAKFANQVTPQSDLSEIQQVQSDFLNNPKIQPQGAGPGPASLNASDAQTMKQGTYQALGSKSYGEVKGASIEAQKALARGLKDEIANQFPEIGKLNAEQSKLLDLQPVLERAVNRTSNHQLIGIGTPVAGAAAQAVTGSGPVGAVVGALKGVLDNPMVKSRLAIAVSKGGGIPYSQALSKVAAYSASLGTVAQSAQGSSGDQTANQ